MKKIHCFVILFDSIWEQNHARQKTCCISININYTYAPFPEFTQKSSTAQRIEKNKQNVYVKCPANTFTRYLYRDGASNKSYNGNYWFKATYLKKARYFAVKAVKEIDRDLSIKNLKNLE